MTARAVPRPTRSRPAVLLLALALALVGCTGEDDPRAELEEAVADTLDTEVAYELRAEADRAALEALGDAAGDAAQFLGDFRVTGAREPDGPTTLSVELAAGEPVLEAVALPDGELRLRTGLGEMLGLVGSPADALGPELDARGVSEQQRTALVAGFAGDWIAIADAGGLDGVLEGGDEANRPTLDRERVLRHVEVTGVSEGDELRRFSVLVDVAGLLGGLDGAEGLDEPVAAEIDVLDGLVHRVRVDLADGLGDEQGGVRLELGVTEHGDAGVGEPPPVEATVSTEELEELLELIGQE